MNESYSTEKTSLIDPSQRANFFVGGLPKSDAALCAQMSWLTYCRSGYDFSFDKEKIRTTLKRVGFAVDNRFWESQGQPQGTGTHSFLALGKHPITQEEIAVLAFRGADPGHFELLLDDKMAILEPWDFGGRVGRLFNVYLLEVWENMLSTLLSIHHTLFMTGHGLGAALATLMASVRTPAALYTFGSPKVGDADFAASLAHLKSYRYVNCCDLVPQTPQKNSDFVHLGKPWYIDSNRKVTFDPQNIGNDQFQAAIRYKTNESWKSGNLPDREAADHCPINYVTAII